MSGRGPDRLISNQLGYFWKLGDFCKDQVAQINGNIFGHFFLKQFFKLSPKKQLQNCCRYIMVPKSGLM
jgi:hypothetical protein